ncbi:MAG: potassium channel family protein [Leptolyngbyaceae cyanobacterium]|mgnify:CR=1 FL=1
MYLIVIGAEAEGRRLIDMATSDGHEVTLIEPNEERARQVLKENQIRVLQGDIADDHILDEANIERADAVIAATHDDSKNLMAMVLAKEFEVKTRISLINQQSHSSLFEHLDVKSVRDPAGIVAGYLYEHID